MSIPGVRVNVHVRVRVNVHFHIFVNIHVQPFLIIYAACMLQPKIRKIAKIVIVSPFNSPTAAALYIVQHVQWLCAKHRNRGLVKHSKCCEEAVTGFMLLPWGVPLNFRQDNFSVRIFGAWFRLVLVRGRQ
jgi:hypothetical protein